MNKNLVFELDSEKVKDFLESTDNKSYYKAIERAKKNMDGNLVNFQ